MKNLYFDARRGVSVPYEHPPAGSGRQLERIAAESCRAPVWDADLNTTAGSRAAPCCGRSAAWWRCWKGMRRRRT